MVSSQNTNHLFNDPTSFLPPAHSIAFPQFPSSHGAGPPTPTRPVPTGISSRTSLNYVPDASFVNPTVASLSMRRFIAHILSLDGYRAAEPDAMSRLELEVISCKWPIHFSDQTIYSSLVIENLFGLAKCFAELSGRTMPTAEDMLSACEELNTDFMSLRKHSKSYKKELNSMLRTKTIMYSIFIIAVGTKQSTLVPPLSTSSTPELLSSDDEGAPLVIPPTLRSLPSHLPTLPPKHTYLRTPVSLPFYELRRVF